MSVAELADCLARLREDGDVFLFQWLVFADFQSPVCFPMVEAEWWLVPQEAGRDADRWDALIEACRSVFARPVCFFVERSSADSSPDVLFASSILFFVPVNDGSQSLAAVHGERQPGRESEK